MRASTPIFLGVDQSLRSTGVFWLGEGIVGWRLIQTKELRGVERLKFIKDALSKIIDDLKPDNIKVAALEGASYGSRGKLFELGEVSGIVKTVLTSASVPVILVVPPTQVKKFAGGGKFEKEDVIKFVNKTMNLSFGLKDSDICDSCVLSMIAQQLDEPTTKIRSQLEVLKTLKG